MGFLDDLARTREAAEGIEGAHASVGLGRAVYVLGRRAVVEEAFALFALMITMLQALVAHHDVEGAAPGVGMLELPRLDAALHKGADDGCVKPQVQ